MSDYKPVRPGPIRTINDDDFESGGLKQLSNVRPNRLFTADERIILYRVGHLNGDIVREIADRIVEIIQR